MPSIFTPPLAPLRPHLAVEEIARFAEVFHEVLRLTVVDETCLLLVPHNLDADALRFDIGCADDYCCCSEPVSVAVLSEHDTLDGRCDPVSLSSMDQLGEYLYSYASYLHGADGALEAA